MKKTILLLTFLCCSIGLLISCSDDDNSSENSYAYSVRLTDAPGPYDAVYIDLQGVEIIGDNGATVNLATQTGIYDLLELSSGVETTISNDMITASKVNQVRLILGTQNSVVVDGVSYPLETPSAQQSGLKLQVNQTLDANTQNSVLIDFDANKSIVVNGNGTYSLKPVLRTIDLSTTGSIEGSISIPGILASVKVESSTGQEVYTNVKSDGNFKVLGLTAGNYTVTITPILPYLPAIESNVNVQVGSTTDIGVVTIQ